MKSNFVGRNLGLGLALSLGVGVLGPMVVPAPAEACFFWQACARRRGRASNTRAGGKRTGFIRGGNNGAVPYVITPRNTWVGQAPQRVRWHSVAGTRRYTVRLWLWGYGRNTPSLMLWETVVDGTNEVPFPDVPLRLGSYYSIEVITEGGVSSHLDEGSYSAGFQLLALEDYELLRSHLTQVTTQVTTQATALVTAEAITQVTAENAPNPDLDVALAEAGVYFLDELYADALQVLEPLAQDPGASELVYIALGDIYNETGLNQLSLQAYGQALRIATGNNGERGDRLSEATIRVKLADVHGHLGDFDQAQAFLLGARQIYAQLDDSLEVARLNRRLGALGIEAN